MRLSIFQLLISLTFFSCQETKSPLLGTLDFEKNEPQEFTVLETKFGKWTAVDGVASIIKETSGNKKSIKIKEGDNIAIEFEPASIVSDSKYYSFVLKRTSGIKPEVHFEKLANGVWQTISDFENIDWNDLEGLTVNIPVLESPTSKIKLISSSQSGLIIEQVQFLSKVPMVIGSVSTYQSVTPALIGKDVNPVLQLKVETTGLNEPQKITSLDIASIGTSDINDIEQVKVYFTGSRNGFSAENQFGGTQLPAEFMIINGEAELSHGTNYFWISYRLKEKANLLNKIDVDITSITFGNGTRKELDTSTNDYSKRIGYALRKHWDDSIHTYRIPGLATTNNGTLIGVYDNRRNSSVDLQEDVDVGMSRSTDGGNTWEPMKVIMDMDKWGGKPQSENGIGDPSILVDSQTNAIWVAGIWAHGHPGQRNWFASKQGLEPEQTSQFVLVKSEDDGLTWSDPINITKQIKDSKWHLLLEGPGKGITMKNGTLVFPAQFKDENQVPHSTIISSKDRGKTWKIGTGVRHETTEAQVVELEDGSIMINARNNGASNKKGIGRVVSTTKDLGQTWQEHQSSITALEESTCMGSLVYLEFEKYGKLLLFSNPNTHSGRHHITIKASLDQGITWPLDKQLLLDEGNGRGYSCLTKIDENTIGILYEGSQADLIFEKVRISEIMKY